MVTQFINVAVCFHGANTWLSSTIPKAQTRIWYIVSSDKFSIPPPPVINVSTLEALGSTIHSTSKMLALWPYNVETCLPCVTSKNLTKASLPTVTMDVESKTLTFQIPLTWACSILALTVASFVFQIMTLKIMWITCFQFFIPIINATRNKLVLHSVIIDVHAPNHQIVTLVFLQLDGTTRFNFSRH